METPAFTIFRRLVFIFRGSVAPLRPPPFVFRGSLFPSRRLLVVPPMLVVSYPRPVVFFVRFLEAVSSKVAGAAAMPAYEPSVVSSFRCEGLGLPELPGLLGPETLRLLHRLLQPRGPDCRPC